MNSKIYNLKIITILLAISIISSYSLGMFYEKNVIANVIMLFLILFIGRLSLPTSIILLLFIAVCGLYAPTGIVYGKINQSFIVSILETNQREVIEYVSSLKALNVIISIILFFLGIYFFKTRYITGSKKLLTVCLILFISLNINSWPQRMIKKSVKDFVELKQQMIDYKSLTANKKDSWVIEDSARKKDLVIVIIGESLRKDYMSSFGYRLKTTPWLDEQNGYFFSNYISAAPVTAVSLPRTLSLTTIPGGMPQLQNNVVSLANKAGYETDWISNQGFLGEYDTIVSAISSYANNTFFMKKGGFSSENKDDSEMLSAINDQIEQNNHKKVIFVHMIGSHPNPCDRLLSYKNTFKNSFSDKKTACYLSTVSKTDNFIKNVVSIAKQKKDYTVIYFSDHGLSIDGSTPPHHCAKFKECYSVPLIIMSNNDSKRIVKNEKTSAFNFISIYSKIIGVKPKGVTPFSFEKTTSTNVSVFKDDRLVNYDKLENQRAI